MTLQKGMSNKEKRMLKAARKRWQENKDLKTIANELNLAYKTVRNYFSGDKMQRFERYYSESDKQLLEAQLEQMIKDGTSTALDIESDLKTDEDVSPRVKDREEWIWLDDAEVPVVSLDRKKVNTKKD